MRMKRALPAVFLALAMAPGTFVRTDLPERDVRSPIEFRALSIDPLTAGPLQLESAWELVSTNSLAGGFSSLVQRPDGTFLSASDSGRLINFARPDSVVAPIRLQPFLATRRDNKLEVDVESLAIDPRTGEVWAALEHSQEIIRVGSRLDRRASVRAREMTDWGKNAGPEAMVRLADGRFLVIEERPSRDGLHAALLFPGDPVAGGKPMAFRFQAREGFRPAEVAQLPDGRLAVLLRKLEWAFPPRFPVQIVIADPSEIAEEKVLRSTPLALIDEPLPSDNYEGMAVIDEGDGTWTLWLISDDNYAYYQRTLLLKFRWDQRELPAQQKARR